MFQIKAVAKIEVLTAFALVNVLTDLRWAFHVQDKAPAIHYQEFVLFCKNLCEFLLNIFAS